MRQSRFEKIKNGLPEIMSAFLRQLLNARSVNKKLMFVRNVQYSMDDCVVNICLMYECNI